MDQLLEAFRQGLWESEVQAGVGVRYPAHLRQLAVRYFEQARKAGESRRRVAEDLGVADATLRRWVEEAEALVGPVESVSLREVVLADSCPAGRSLSLVTPEGFRVEGLDVSGLVALLGALR